MAATQRLLRDATAAELATIAAALVRDEPLAILRECPKIPIGPRVACEMLFACSREEAEMIPLDVFHKKLKTAIGREQWGAKLEALGYRIDPAELSDKPARQRNDEPDEAEIALARAACVANPKILRSDLMEKLGIGSDKASKLIDLMRKEGIHKTRKRKSPSKSG